MTGFYGPLSRPRVTFVAVSQQTSDQWFAVMLGMAGAIPFALAIVALRAVLS